MDKSRPQGTLLHFSQLVEFSSFSFLDMDWTISNYEHNRTMEIMHDIFDLLESIDLVLHFEDII